MSTAERAEYSRSSRKAHGSMPVSLTLHDATKFFPAAKIPALQDPRWPVFFTLSTYVIAGITVLNFNRTPAQILTAVAAACLLDMGLHFCLRQRTLLFPLSAAISGMGISILANYAHGAWLALIPVFFSIASKYVFTFKGRHVFNPTMFGITASLLLGGGMISAAPAYQWGGTTAVAAFIVTCALLLFVFRIKRGPLILSFLFFFFLQTSFRAWLTRYHVPPETLFLGALSSPALYLFTFFMITDPRTSPNSAREQIFMSFCIVLLDLILHKFHTLSTIFYAGIIYAFLRYLFLHLCEIIRVRGRYVTQLKSGLANFAACGLLAVIGGIAYRSVIRPLSVTVPAFRFEAISAEQSGIVARKGDLLEFIDAKAANVGKWLLSLGDAAAVADANFDGLSDLFLTLPLKDGKDRAALYLNRGNFNFERFNIPALSALALAPQREGVPAGALWFDYDNDGDQDLLVTVAWGNTVFLKNLLRENGILQFVDVTAELGLRDYTISVKGNVLDFNQDGKLDLIIANAMSRFLPGYNTPTIFNIFSLPDPEFSGDRRMLNIMHRTWYDAKNGGEKFIYLNKGGNGFARLNQTGIDGTRWTLDIGAGDLNGDGLADLYFANDFGPDELYIGMKDGRFKKIQGAISGELGRDTYKGMNASFGDLDNNGFADIYVSNVHAELQAEGSLLWMNDGSVLERGHSSFRDEAVAKNALNENRFGWGAALGDLDRDGKLDIVQANGHIDDAYDKKDPQCEDFWYWNAQIGLTSPDIHGYTDSWADIRGRCIFPNEFNRVYLNRGGHFVDVAQEVGWSLPGTSRGIALADFDNDGDLDAVVTRMYAPPTLYRNAAAPRGWLGVELVGNGITCNMDAVGSKVTVFPPKGSDLAVQTREVYASNGLSAQGDRRVLFGLGVVTEDVQLEITWCGFGATEQRKVPINRYLRIVQEGNAL